MSNESVLNAFPGAGGSSSGATISIPSFDGVETKAYYLPPGSYRAKVSSFKQDVSQAGNKMLVFEFDVTGPSGTLNGRRFFCPLTPAAMWKLQRTCVALGIPEGQGISVKEVTGRECMVTMMDDGESDSGDKYCKIKECDPLPSKAPEPSVFGASLPPGPEGDDVPF